MRQVGAARRAVVVVNELAPGARAANWTELFHETLGAHVELTEVRVRGFEGAFAAARGAAAWGAELVIAVGGDGTANACVNGIGDAATRLAVVPAGTANDLAHLVGLHGIPTEDAVTMAAWGRRDLDAIDVNGTRYYSAGGVGFVADVAATANRWRAGGFLRRWLLARLGSLIYVLASLAVIFSRKPIGGTFRIRYVDATTRREEEIELDLYGCLVASSSKVGKSFGLAPVSKMDDGAFELIPIPKTTRMRLLKTMLMAQSGRMFDLPEMRWIQVRSATMECNRPVRFFGDGEILDRGKRFELGIAATPVRIMAPAMAENESLALHLALQRV